MNPITIASIIVYCLCFFAFPWLTITDREVYLYMVMSDRINLDFLCIPLLIGAAVMGSSSSTKVISIILGVIGLGIAGNRFYKTISTDLQGALEVLEPSVELGMYLVIGFAIINIIVTAQND